jgi:group I intron endonuclease
MVSSNCEQIGIIYKSTCLISKKIYYGQSINSLEDRKRSHKKFAKYYKNTKTKFLNAIRKYGFENFEWEIIEEHKSKDKKELAEILNKRETFYIARDNTIKGGYNIRSGGNNSPLSEETKEILRNNILGKSVEDLYGIEKAKNMKLHSSLALKGKSKSEKHKKNISQSHLGDQNPNFGKPAWDAINKILKICEYCGMETNPGNYVRWHGDRCKKFVNK